MTPAPARPRTAHAFAGKLMKSVVDFNRREPLGVVPQHLLLRKFFRVEVSLPLLEAVAAGADEEAHFVCSVFEILK